ncbi:MAG: F0F1 ATP synthase subunit alpha, partial [Bacteroidota bacterium]
LDLAQYRELEAFAKFGSDLDPATQSQLNRGARLVEILKQAEREPRAVEDQIAIIYVATNGYLDALPIDSILAFEKEFIDQLHLQHEDAMQSILSTGKMSDDVAQLLANEATKLVEAMNS